MTDAHVLPQILLFLGVAVVAAVLSRRLRASPVLGYLAAGVLIGPHALGLVHDVEQTEGLAHLGVVFLLFTIGLEMSLERMARMRRHVFGLGLLQVATTAAVLWAAARALGIAGDTALVLGAGLAFSSTAVVMRMLAERHEVGTRHGQVALSVLIFQDLAVVPLLALIPLLGVAEGGLAGAIGVSLLRAVVAIAVIVVAGRVLLRPLLRVVAAGRSPEVFTGTVLLLVLGVSWATEEAGLSMALGAFLAGMLIAETEFRHQFEGDIEPFRGLLLALFFVTVGMGIDPALVVREAPAVLGTVAGLLAIKALLLFGLCRLFGLPVGLSAGVSLTLAQGGEFAFVLFGLAGAAGVLPAGTGQVAAVAVAITMALTPLLVVAGRAVERRWSAPGAGTGALAAGTAELAGHVLVGGFGRVGQTMGRVLTAAGVPYVALDLDPGRVAAGRRAGLPVFFGDASRVEVLRAAGMQRAAAAVVTLDDVHGAERAVAAIRATLPDLPVVVRARDSGHHDSLARAGATRVVPEVVEGSLQLGGTVLELLGEGPHEVDAILDTFRADSYERLGGLIPAGSE